jgi:hypothetical protein
VEQPYFKGKNKKFSVIATENAPRGIAARSGERGGQQNVREY